MVALLLKRMIDNNKSRLLTAILLLSDGPENTNILTEKLGLSNDEMNSLINEVNSSFENSNLGFYIKTTNTTLDIHVSQDLVSEISGYVPESILKGLSSPAMETLAIIAYEQPVTKLKVSEIRGVDSDSSIKTLESRGLIQKEGELDLPGGAILYATTDLFVQKMGIGDIAELPRIGSLFEISEEE